MTDGVLRPAEPAWGWVRAGHGRTAPSGHPTAPVPLVCHDTRPEDDRAVPGQPAAWGRARPESPTVPTSSILPLTRRPLTETLPFPHKLSRDSRTPSVFFSDVYYGNLVELLEANLTDPFYYCIPLDF